MIIDEWKDLGASARLLMSVSMCEVPGLNAMIHKLFYDTKEQLMNLNPETEDFNLRYRELQFRKREYEGLLEIFEDGKI